MPDAPLRHVLRLGTDVPATVDLKRRTLRAVAATEDGASRFGAMPGGDYGQWLLQLDMSGADLSRFIGGPVLRDHAATTRDTVGVIEAARIADGKLIADIRLSSRNDVTSLLTDIADGILRGVSVGFETQEFRADGERDGVPVFTATRWTPYELSFTPTPALAGATVLRRDAMSDDTAQPVVPDVQERSATAVKRPKPQPDGDTGDAPTAEKPATIRQVFAMAGMPASAADHAIDGRYTTTQVRDAVYQHLSARGAAQPVIDTRKPAVDHENADLEDALLARLRGSGGSGWRLADIARATLSRQGFLVSGTSDASVFNAVGRQRFASGAIFGAHTTSDFPQLLGSSVGRYLREQYMLAASPLKTVSGQRDRSDFRAGSSIVLGEPPALLEVGEAGMITHDTIGEASASWQVKTYARIFAISRQALVNDDLSGFSRALSGWAVAAAACEADLLFALIAGAGAVVNETGLSLWNTSHGNVASSGAALSVSTLGDAVKALRNQRSVADGHYLALQPRFLLVGLKSEVAARQLLVDVAGVQRADIQPFGGLEVLVEPRITDGAWHLFAAPGPHSPLEFGYLSGAEGVRVDTEDGFETLGTKYRAVLDFSCGVFDCRGAYKNAGAQQNYFSNTCAAVSLPVGQWPAGGTAVPPAGRVTAMAPLPVLLALDLGQHTGWAVRNRDGAIASGTHEFRPGRYEGGGMPFLRFACWLDELRSEMQLVSGGSPATVFFEEVRRHRGVSAAHCYGGFLAHLTAWCEANRIPYQGVPVGTIKRHIAGKGNADKAAVIEAVRALSFQPADDDEADALALLHWAIANGGA